MIHSLIVKTDMSTGGSEETFEFICTPCSKDSVHAEAVVYCVECRECLCQKCFSFHRRLSGLILHKVVDKAGMQAGGAADVTLLPTDTCDVHPGKLIVVYCEDHDALCCVECVIEGHRSCTNAVYVPAKANGFKDSPWLKDLTTTINDFMDEVDRMKVTKQTNLQKSQQDEKTILTEVRSVTDDLVQKIKALEQVSVDMVKNHYDPIENTLLKQIKALDDLKADAKSILSSLSPIDQSEAQLFINEKRGKTRRLNMAEKLLKADLEDQKVEEYHIAITSAINRISCGLTKLNSLVTKTKIFKAKAYGEYSVKSIGDKHLCDITGSCVLPDGTVVLIDYNNSRIKRIDIRSSYRLTCSCALPRSPWGVTCTGPDQVAVTMTGLKTVQFVSTGDIMVLTKSFSTSDKCRGICYSDGTLFVACGGLTKKGFEEGPGHVSVYNMNGVRLRTLQTHRFGWQIPYHIIVSSDGRRVYVAVPKSGVISLPLDDTGKNLTFPSDPSLKHAFCVCSLDNDHILVSCRQSNNVIQLDCNNRSVLEVLRNTDGVEGPQSLCYDSTSSKLIVTMEKTDNIKVFDLI